MGSSIIQLTRSVRTVTSDGAVGIDEAVEVLGFRSARLVLKVYGVDNPDSPHLSVMVQTAMDLKDIENAPILGLFIFSEEKGTVMAQTFTGLLRYVWWTVSDFAGEGADAFHFTLEGVVYD